MRRLRWFSFLVGIMFARAYLLAEDVRLREQAVQLMEVANAVSLPGALAGFEHTVIFRGHEPDGVVKEGTFTRVSAGASSGRSDVWRLPRGHRYFG